MILELILSPNLNSCVLQRRQAMCSYSKKKKNNQLGFKKSSEEQKKPYNVE
ncbi:hypothetical protein Syun_029849 [Stephania yunnanensis]|uniref:Uncharacterized protein n=1 Tax=Stephania yunnanensis TaxID=152371 RepID=A0AAP0E8R0_9MAGN